jgi:hypothetical protein
MTQVSERSVAWQPSDRRQGVLRASRLLKPLPDVVSVSGGRHALESPPRLAGISVTVTVPETVETTSDALIAALAEGVAERSLDAPVSVRVCADSYNERDRRRCVAHLDSGASAVRADRRRTVSGDVRRDGGFWLSHADSVGRRRAGSGYRMGLEAGGHRFDPGTLHRKREAIARFALDPTSSIRNVPPSVDLARRATLRTSREATANRTLAELGAD